ncbi:MAG: hypothetical protein AB7O04_00645 [Hyphomonadaceae bacterium]
MLGYIWFCVMLKAVSPSADMMIARYNATVEALLGAGILEEAPPAAHISRAMLR